MSSSELSNGFLPTDVLVQILVRLPTKSLARFKTVCKNWCRLTSSNYFFQLYYQVSSKNQMIMVEHIKLFNICSTFLCIDASGSISDFSLDFLGDRVKVRASCNGLLCCSSIPNRGLYYVCNPITRDFRSFTKIPERPATRFRHDGEVILVGLAFDPLGKRFKVVLADFYRQFGCRKPDSLVCQVFDSETSSWRKFFTSLNDVFTHMNKNQVVYVNSLLHWLTKSCQYLLVLDLDKGFWNKVQLPDEITNVSGTKVYLLELDGKVSVVKISNSCMITWILKDYGREEWDVEDTISLGCIEALIPSTFPISQTKDFVFLATHRQILIYNRKNKGWREVYSVDKTTVFPLWFYSRAFRATLFSLN